MPNFEVTFCDGKTLVVNTATADQAKQRTRTIRRAQVPPDTPASAAEVKIARVTLLDDAPLRERRD
jgi:hypothetical protein